jgi:hypothetical protein
LAVKIPFSGVTPDAIPKAIASGSATIHNNDARHGIGIKLLFCIVFERM